ncbi:hypothetical protein K443DRAFT_674151 [Laccaria amethystina LaAM-08-1]|jgi:plastocyanin|uniref:Blue (type 1) copper domain-containing protein n=1 Tax=Laccaria amethystina LaAM-08-1 TaxID=1095629 RepID=A0A0C9X2Z2_9AGAR|nr:hypothetical protein K443DRAFT_674151 [Laccaria amethystina LaAM-08-1]
MLTAAFLTAFLFPVLAAAQYDNYGTTTSAATSATVAVAVPSAPANTAGFMNVDVGFQGKLVFNPANISAPVGTIVTFYFPSGLAHSVSQSSFANPCTYLAASGNTSAGFDSGLQTAVQFSINITDNQPIWYHCKQVKHCGLGMVGSINAPATGNTFAAFQSAALALGSSEATETDSGPVTGGVHGVATAKPANTASTTASASSSSSSKSSGSTKVVASACLALSVAAVAGLLAYN